MYLTGGGIWYNTCSNKDIISWFLAVDLFRRTLYVCPFLEQAFLLSSYLYSLLSAKLSWQGSLTIQHLNILKRDRRYHPWKSSEKEENEKEFESRDRTRAFKGPKRHRIRSVSRASISKVRRKILWLMLRGQERKLNTQQPPLPLKRRDMRTNQGVGLVLGSLSL